jgi:hypothetical protein
MVFLNSTGKFLNPVSLTIFFIKFVIEEVFYIFMEFFLVTF